MKLNWRIHLYQCFPLLLPIGGFCNWKLDVDSIVDSGVVKFNVGLKFKPAVGGFIGVFIVIFVADGNGVKFPQAAI